MTSAARPTFDHAKGSEKKVSSSITHKRALNSHSKLKFRNKKARINEEFEAEESNDSADDDTGDGRKIGDISRENIAQLKEELESHGNESTEGDQRGNDSETAADGTKTRGLIANDSRSLSEENNSDEEEESDESGEEDEDEDDEEELLREIEQIKKEREDAKNKQELAEAEERAKTSNPLIHVAGMVDSGDKITDEKPKKKTWRSAKSMAKKSTLSEADRFSNDTIKTDFHKEFLDKYVR